MHLDIDGTGGAFMTSLRQLRGGMAPCRVIFHENVNFLFVAQKCQVIHAFHKTYNKM